MNFAVCVLTIICLLTIIGSGSIVVSLVKGTSPTTQYIPTQPTQLYYRTNNSHVNVNNNKELEKDIAKDTFLDDYFGDDELEIGEELEVE